MANSAPLTEFQQKAVALMVGKFISYYDSYQLRPKPELEGCFENWFNDNCAAQDLAFYIWRGVMQKLIARRR